MIRRCLRLCDRFACTMFLTYNVNRVGLIQMPTQKLTTEILAAAIEGFEAQKRRIDEQIAQLRQMLDSGRTEPAGTTEAPRGNRRKMSAAARKRISDAQKKRWAASKRPSETPSRAAAASETPKRKRKISAAGKRAIAAATKKRWAAFRAAKAAEKPGFAKTGAAKKIGRKAAKKVLTKVAKKTAAKRPAKKAPESAAPVAAQ